TPDGYWPLSGRFALLTSSKVMVTVPLVVGVAAGVLVMGIGVAVGVLVAGRDVDVGVLVGDKPPSGSGMVPRVSDAPACSRKKPPSSSAFSEIRVLPLMGGGLVTPSCPASQKQVAPSAPRPNRNATTPAWT